VKGLKDDAGSDEGAGVRDQVVKATIEGNTTALVVGSRNETATQTTGAISAMLEGGAWKVGKEKWSSISRWSPRTLPADPSARPVRVA
jgi:hypothetical protein